MKFIADSDPRPPALQVADTITANNSQCHTVASINIFLFSNTQKKCDKVPHSVNYQVSHTVYMHSRSWY
jgi:hypothetical protein